MNDVPAPLSGAMTIALIVGLGIFVYPWLLTQRYGLLVIALMTVLLGALFVLFQGEGSNFSKAMAAGWALGPVIAGIIVWHISRDD